MTMILWKASKPVVWDETANLYHRFLLYRLLYLQSRHCSQNCS